MLRHYLTTTLRNVFRQKYYAAINVAGLAIGISCSLIIFMIVRDELSFDRFHKNADRIYCITLDAHMLNREFITARSSGPVAASLQAELPEVEAATHIRSRSGTPTSDCAVRYGDKAFNEFLLFFADSAFFMELVSKEFVALVLIANLLAWPVAYYFINGWLQNFAYRIELGWGMFLLAGGLALLIALITVSVQVIKAALANPVEALRYE